MAEPWIDRWQEGRTGWHEDDGSALLRRHWPRLVRGSAVLVPFCGKSVDLVWLGSQGLKVTGIELSEIAVRAFFDENELDFEISKNNRLPCYRASSVPIRLYCGDFFEFEPDVGEGPFQGLYDRGALVAVPAADRGHYVEHTCAMLEPDAYKMVISLEYEQQRVAGPPWSVPAAEISAYWPDLECIKTRNDIKTGAPKFRKAGLTEVIESVWTSA